METRRPPHNLCWIDDRLVPLLTELASTAGRLAGRQDALGILQPARTAGTDSAETAANGAENLDEWIGQLVSRWLPAERGWWRMEAGQPVHANLATAERMQLLQQLTEAINNEIFKLDQQLERERMKLRLVGIPLNRRQLGMINLLMGDFPKRLTSTRWARITRCSPDTALRDISDLVAHGVLARDGAGGRSTTYSLSIGD